jgi:hypothetical protein
MNVEYYEWRSKNSPSNSLGATGFREWCVVPAVWDKVKFPGTRGAGFADGLEEVVGEPLQTNRRSCDIRLALNPRQYERQLRLQISIIVARIGLHEVDADVRSRVVLLLSSR